MQVCSSRLVYSTGKRALPEQQGSSMACAVSRIGNLQWPVLFSRLVCCEVTFAVLDMSHKNGMCCFWTYSLISMGCAPHIKLSGLLAAFADL